MRGLRGHHNHEDEPVEYFIELAIQHCYELITSAYRGGLKLGYDPPIVAMSIKGKLGVGKAEFEVQPMQASAFAESTGADGYPGMADDFLGRLARVKEGHAWSTCTSKTKIGSRPSRSRSSATRRTTDVPVLPPITPSKRAIPKTPRSPGAILLDQVTRSGPPGIEQKDWGGPPGKTDSDTT